MNNTNSVKRWIVDYPGHFDGADAAECLELARDAYQDASGDSCGPEFFAAVLDRHGYKSQIVRNVRDGNPPLYRLALPARPVTPHDNSGALARLR